MFLRGNVTTAELSLILSDGLCSDNISFENRCDCELKGAAIQTEIYF